MPSTALLEDMTWPEAERALTRDAVVVVPIGAASKEHGPHLRLANDWIMADYLRRIDSLRAPGARADTTTSARNAAAKSGASAR